MANISSSTYFEIVSYMRVAILNIATFYCGWVGLNFEASFAEQDGYFPVYCTSVNYNRELLLGQESQLAGLVLERSNLLIVGGTKISLTIERRSSNRCMAGNIGGN